MNNLLFIGQDGLSGIIGPWPSGVFLAALFWAYLVAFARILYNIATRDPLKTNSPVKTDWGHFFQWNALRVGLNVILILVFVRFSGPPIVNKLSEESRELYYLIAALIGWGNDWLAATLNNWSNKVKTKLNDRDI